MNVWASMRLAMALFISVIVVVIAFTALNRFLRAGLLPCYAGWTGPLLVSLGLALLLQLFIAPRILPGHYKAFLAAHLLLILAALWLGSYALSPLGYSTGRIPNLRGFHIFRANRRALIANNEVISLKAGTAVGINSLLLDEASACQWISAAGAELDGATSCDLVYVPPKEDYDVLRVRIRSGCGFPDSAGRIQIAILP